MSCSLIQLLTSFSSLNTLKKFLLLASFLGAALNCEGNIELKFDDNRLAMDSPDSLVTSLVTAKFLFIDKDGFPSASNEFCLIAFVDQVYPKIIDVIFGHSPELDVFDAGEDGNQGVALFYTSGARQYCLRLYRLENDGCQPLDNEEVASNMHYIQLTNNTIVVKNQGFISENEVEIETKRFVIQNEGIDLLKIDRKRIKR